MRKLLDENYSDKEAFKICESKWKKFVPGQKQMYLQIADNYKQKLEKDKEKLERDKQKIERDKQKEIEKNLLEKAKEAYDIEKVLKELNEIESKSAIQTKKSKKRRKKKVKNNVGELTEIKDNSENDKQTDSVMDDENIQKSSEDGTSVENISEIFSNIDISCIETDHEKNGIDSENEIPAQNENEFYENKGASGGSSFELSPSILKYLEMLEEENNNLKKSQQIVEQENQKLKEIKESHCCIICMDNEISTVFLPCGHLLSCFDCASFLKKCPICRQPIKNKYRTFSV